MWGVLPEGGMRDNRDWPNLVPQQITPDYFRTMGMRVLAGREFTADDRSGGPYVAIITASAAKSLWPEGGNPLGRRFSIGRPENTRLMTVVGVVDDFLSRGYHDTPEPTMFIPYPQTRESAYVMPRSMSLIVRTNGDPMLLAGRVREIVRELDSRAPVSRVSTLSSLVDSSISNRQFSTSLLAGFAALALLLAAIGIYGVVSHGVSERTFEIGVRMALGARRSSVLSLVLSEGIRMAAVGILIGLAGAAAIGRLIKSMLVDVSSFDLPVIIAVSAALLFIALIASLVPAQRAVLVNPLKALRE
jgi:predicted permease